MNKQFVIFEAAWDKAAHCFHSGYNMMKYYNRDAIVVASLEVDAIFIFNKNFLGFNTNNHQIINNTFVKVKENSSFFVYMFAYEGHLFEDMVMKDIQITLEKHHGPKPYVQPYKNIAFKPANVDPATMRLMQDALPMHGGDKCPTCGDAGYKVRTAIMCSKGHGIIGGF